MDVPHGHHIAAIIMAGETDIDGIIQQLLRVSRAWGL
jgi:hypothetical protein